MKTQNLRLKVQPLANYVCKVQFTWQAKHKTKTSAKQYLHIWEHSESSLEMAQEIPVELGCLQTAFYFKITRFPEKNKQKTTPLKPATTTKRHVHYLCDLKSHLFSFSSLTLHNWEVLLIQILSQQVNGKKSPQMAGEKPQARSKEWCCCRVPKGSWIICPDRNFLPCSEGKLVKYLRYLCLSVLAAPVCITAMFVAIYAYSCVCISHLYMGEYLKYRSP